MVVLGVSIAVDDSQPIAIGMGEDVVFECRGYTCSQLPNQVCWGLTRQYDWPGAVATPGRGMGLGELV